MSVSFVDSTPKDLSAASNDVTLPDLASGDLLVVAIVYDGTSVSSVTSGWTLLFSETATEMETRVYYKISNGTETTFNITLSGTAYGAAVAASFRSTKGFKNGAPISQYSINEVTGTETITTTAINTAGGAVLALFGYEDAATVFSFAPVSGYTLARQNSCDLGDRVQALMLMYKLVAASAESPSETVSGFGDPDTGIGVLMELAESGGGGFFFGTNH